MCSIKVSVKLRHPNGLVLFKTVGKGYFSRSNQNIRGNCPVYLKINIELLQNRLLFWHFESFLENKKIY